jgi:hypothetical protein
MKRKQKTYSAKEAAAAHGLLPQYALPYLSEFWRENRLGGAYFGSRADGLAIIFKRYFDAETP